MTRSSFFFFFVVAAVVLILTVSLLATTSLVTAKKKRKQPERPPLEQLPVNDTRKLTQRQFRGALDRFHSWFEEHYGQKLLVRVIPVEGARLGVEAQVKLRPGMPYLNVPLDMCIDDKSLTTGSRAPPHFAAFDAWLRQHQRELPMTRVQLLMATFLLYGRWVAPNTTFWTPYLDLLPRKLQTPEHTFTENDLVLMDGLPRMRAEIRANRKKRDAELRWLRERVLKHPLFGEQLLPEWVLTRGRWSWAVGILNTRMIWFDNGPHLVPMLDMVNCDAGPALQDKQHVHQTVREGDRAVTRAGWLIQKGDEVLENYGQSNAYYFLHHGFMLTNNPHDCFFIDLPPVTREVTRRAQFLARPGSQNAFRDMQICFSMTNKKRFDAAVDLARIYTLPDRALETAMLKRQLPDKDTDKQTRRVLRFLGKRLKEKQAELVDGTLRKYDRREPDIEDAPHKDLIYDYADNSVGRPLDDAIIELKKRVRLLSEQINMRESKKVREKIAKEQEQQRRQEEQQQRGPLSVEEDGPEIEIQPEGKLPEGAPYATSNPPQQQQQQQGGGKTKPPAPPRRDNVRGSKLPLDIDDSF